MVVFGASGHAKVIIEILLQSGITISKILDHNPRSNCHFGITVEKIAEETIFPKGEKAFIAIGCNKARYKIAESYPLDFIQAIHPLASISGYAEVGAGSLVVTHVVVGPDARVGRHCILNTGAVISHDCILEDFVHVSPNAALAGGVTIREGAHIGIGASIIPGVTIGRWAKIGAGAVVLSDVPDYAVVVGNPANPIKFNDPSEYPD